MTQKPSPSVRIFKPRPNARVRLFCFTYAGGSAQIYKDWGDTLGEDIEVCGIQLPGRAGRFRDARYTSVDAAVAAIVSEIEHLADRPVALYGHSLGAAMAFEMGLALQAKNKAPHMVIVSGMMSPPNPSLEPAIYHLPDREFREKVKEFEGTPQEILEHEELMDLMLPLLKADFTMADTYTYQQGRVLDCALVAHGGTEDAHTHEEGIVDWKNYTSGPFNHHVFVGDHFFINAIPDQVLAHIKEQLTASL